MAKTTYLTCTTAVFAGLSSDILCHGQSLRFQARGISMQPLIRDGDIVQVEPLGDRLPRVGDVVLCSDRPERVLVHRVMRRQFNPDGNRYLVQGDQVVQPDGWFSQDQVFGRIVMIERNNTCIDMHGLAMTTLGLYKVMQKRWHLESNDLAQKTKKILKSLPVINALIS